MRSLDVHLFDRFTGLLSLVDEDGGPEAWRFTYDAAYVTDPSATALSETIKVRAASYEGAVVRNWFCNLLPEGAVRDGITTRLRIDPRDDFALLAAIGGECAGAVSIVDASSPPFEQSGDGEDLETLLSETGTAEDGDWALLATPHRLSLAGAQDKLAVVREANGRLRFPRRHEPSTHILKPESLAIAGLRDLEVFGLFLARAVGLRTAAAEPVMVAGRKALLVERYDRVVDDGGVRRLHQEDFCQALGYPAELKYQSQGGPSLTRCAELIRSAGLGPDAVMGFLDWVAFTVIIGNADAHAKNLALLRAPGGARSLAPFYDLVPTMVFDESQLDRTPAMKIGTARRIDQVSGEDLKLFARETGYTPRLVLPRIRELAGSVERVVSVVAGELEGMGVTSRRLEKAVEVVGKNAARLRRELM